MLKKCLLLITCIIVALPVLAHASAEIRLNITTPTTENRYYLCLYDTGCLNIKAGTHGKTFPIATYDISNILQFVVTDIKTMNMYRTPTNDSCNVKLKPNQRLTISGTLVTAQHEVKIKHLHCQVS